MKREIKLYRVNIQRFPFSELILEADNKQEAETLFMQRLLETIREARLDSVELWHWLQFRSTPMIFKNGTCYIKGELK